MRSIPLLLAAAAALLSTVAPAAAQGSPDPTAGAVAGVLAPTAADDAIERVMPRVIAWRRDIHEHPELSNREVRTGALVAAHLKALGLEVREKVAHTGVVGVLRGGRPGPVIALRADMDALPVTEETDLPFRSVARSTYNGQDVGVMHACGHDAHTAMLMGAAEVLAGMRAELAGTVVFIFQPAEEGVPAGETGGAPQMIREGVLDDPKVDAIFGLHAFSRLPTGTLHYRPLGIMASSDELRIVVRGRQTHGALPWQGVDPIVVSAQIVTALQTITARQTDVTLAPAIVTIGVVRGGTRFNIIPDSVVMQGTVRAFDDGMQQDIHARIRRTAERIAESAGATAEVTIAEGGNPVTSNDPALTERLLPSLQRAAGAENVMLAQVTTTAEDFSHYQRRVPGVFVFLGITPPGAELARAAPNHSPLFMIDEAALPVGVRTLVTVARDYLTAP